MAPSRILMVALFSEILSGRVNPATPLPSGATRRNCAGATRLSAKRPLFCSESMVPVQASSAQLPLTRSEASKRGLLALTSIVWPLRVPLVCRRALSILIDGDS